MDAIDLHLWVFKIAEATTANPQLRKSRPFLWVEGEYETAKISRINQQVCRLTDGKKKCRQQRNKELVFLRLFQI